ncbi:MAG TPA: molybdenum cofactor biosynthesis protein MoaE [Burkholderiales bacterium]
MPAEVRTSAFEPYEELRRYQERFLSGRGAAGATASFVGTMRDFNDGEPVRAMTLEHYPGMTERHLERIVAEAKQRWPILDALVLHRVGPLLPGDPIVLVAAWSAHRDAAFAACRYLIEELKSRAPFWKKEERASAARWVERNAPAEGYTVEAHG